MKKVFLLLLAIVICAGAFAAAEEEVVLKNSWGEIYGTLLMPETTGKVPLVIIIAGSGPTDRNGNQAQMPNNSLKMLADSLCAHNIASLRYDKRGIAASFRQGQQEADVRLDDFIGDAKDWIAKYSGDQRFSKIFIAGHSEGSLIGLVASAGNPAIAGMISIAGTGRTLDIILKEQLGPQLPDDMREKTFRSIDRLKAGETDDSYPKELESLFRPSVQPFVISSMRYDACKEAAKLKVPMLVIQGTTDIQVRTLDADMLAASNPLSVKVIIEGMNHVLKDCTTTDRIAQLPVYTDPSLPLNAELVETIVKFIG